MLVRSYSNGIEISHEMHVTAALMRLKGDRPRERLFRDRHLQDMFMQNYELNTKRCKSRVSNCQGTPLMREIAFLIIW